MQIPTDLRFVSSSSDATAPFGGYKMSGVGRELGEYTLELSTEIKIVYVNRA